MSAADVWKIDVWPITADTAAAGKFAIYLVQAAWSPSQARVVAEQLFADPICEGYAVYAPAGELIAHRGQRPSGHMLEVHLLPGVMDPAAASSELALRDMQLPVQSVRTARGFIFAQPPTPAEQASLYNPAIERLADGTLGNLPPPVPPEQPFVLRRVPIIDLDDDQLMHLSKQMHMFLDLREMQAIRAHYQAIGREPTDIELETIAQTWSEHCVHKTFKAAVEYKARDGELGAASADQPHIPSHYSNLIKQTVFAATQALARPWCLSVFKDNAGVIEFDDQWAVCFKVETHNRPSAIEPYGGAATGIGGCIRDVLGTGLAAKPIANTDVFCFAPPGTKHPGNGLRPERVIPGVVAGVRDYGNRMGIPTVNGTLYFDPRYVANPLVFCGCVGLIPRNKIDKHVQPGDHIVVVGGRTGRDGIHGATFSSGEIEHNTAQTFGGAVQIGNAITQKKMMDVLLRARDLGPGRSSLFRSVTDCGAGGLSSAVGEMGAETGAVVHLDRVPLKYAGLRYDEIWISEAQERMVLAVPPEHVAELIELFAAEDVEATSIGVFGPHVAQPPSAVQPDVNSPATVRLYFHQALVGELACAFLHEGLPKRSLRAEWSVPGLGPTGQVDDASPAAAATSVDLHQLLLTHLASLNVASKAWVWRQYDHEVQGGTVLKPYATPAGDPLDAGGPTDAAVIRPLAGSPRGVVIANGLCPHLSDHDPYWMAFASVDEAVRNIVAVGGDPLRTAILDNFCWGTCTKPDRLGALVRACQGCHDAALVYGTPFISGKDSLNNEFNAADGTNLTIPGTLLISAISVMTDVARVVRPTLSVGQPLFLVGQPTRWPWAADHPGLPLFDPAGAARTHLGLAELIREMLVSACHDVSDGGLLVTVAEMVLASDCAAVLAGHAALCETRDIAPVPPTFRSPGNLPLSAALFGEWAGCYVVQTTQPLAFTQRAQQLGLPYLGLGMAVPPDDEHDIALVARRGSGTADVQAFWTRTELRTAWNTRAI